MFGIRSDTTKALHLNELHELTEAWFKSMEAGAAPPVDIFPISKWIPQRFFTTRGRNVGIAADKLYGRMISHVIQRRLGADSRRSFLDDVLDQQEKLVESG